jgi:hypothetical protein
MAATVVHVIEIDQAALVVPGPRDVQWWTEFLPVWFREPNWWTLLESQWRTGNIEVRPYDHVVVVDACDVRHAARMLEWLVQRSALRNYFTEPARSMRRIQKTTAPAQAVRL